MRFRLKLMLSTLGLLALLFGVGGSLLISFSFHSALEREKDAAFGAYQMVLSTLQIVDKLAISRGEQAAAGTLEQLSRQNAAWTALRLSSERGVIYETPTAAQDIRGDLEPQEVGKCRFHQADSPDGAHRLILTGTIASGDGTLTLQMAHDITALYTARQAQQQTYLWVFAAMALLCAVLSVPVSRLLTGPLEELSRTSRAIATGDFSSRVQVRSQDEIGAVARDFNAMAAQMEDTVLELQASVERQERFLGSFAHEVKTPMTSIIGYAELLRSGGLTGEEQTEAAGYIFSEGKRMERLSRKLLELLALKQGGLALVEICPADLVKELTDQLRPIYAAQGIDLSCTCQEGTCLLEPDLVRSLLWNLMDNARKAMDEGGIIGVSLNMLEDGCCIQIQDNGRGIPADALAHLTEAFYRADKARSRAQGGVGLGLTLCQEIARLHHGAISFENRAERETCVTVELRGGRP